MKLASSLAARWQEISQREQRMVLAALAFVLAVLLWWLAVAPALQTLRHAPGQRRQLETQLQQMLSLQTQAKALQAQPRIAFEDARRLLEASVQPLGTTAQVTLSGERVSLTLKGIPADALARWLTQVRLNVRAVPGEAHLVRNSAGTWDGSLLLNLGTAPSR